MPIKNYFKSRTSFYSYAKSTSGQTCHGKWIWKLLQHHTGVTPIRCSSFYNYALQRYLKKIQTGYTEYQHNYRLLNIVTTNEKKILLHSKYSNPRSRINNLSRQECISHARYIDSGALLNSFDHNLAEKMRVPRQRETMRKGNLQRKNMFLFAKVK